MVYSSYKKIDDVGRIVLPKDIREELGIKLNEMLKIDVEDGKIVICKAEDSCVFCGKNDGLKKYMGKTVCKNCVNELNNT